MIYHSLILYISLILLWCHTYVSSHPALGCLVLFSGICGHLHTQGKGREEKPSFCPWRVRVLLVLTDNVEMREPQPHPVKKTFSVSHLLFFLLFFPTFFSQISSPVAEDVLKLSMSLRMTFNLLSLSLHIPRAGTTSIYNQVWFLQS